MWLTGRYYLRRFEMRYCFDLDETICATPSSRNYAEAIPYYKMIDKINALFEDGHEITIFTARGGTSGINYHELNVSQLSKWGVKYHKLIDSGKPGYDLLIDDKAIASSVWRESVGIKLIGLVASAFDLLHAGHCLYLMEAKSVCDYLIAALHDDPSVERTYKNKPVQSLAERRIQLESVKYVDEVIVYNTEEELSAICKKICPDVRILGSDYTGKLVTGSEYCKTIYYHHRNHDYSSTELRSRIYDAR
jgi:cytidyltransferase-like protein